MHQQEQSIIWTFLREMDIPIQSLSINLDISQQDIKNHINNIHERAHRLTYKDNQTSFKELSEKDHSVTVHQKNLQVLVTKIFKNKNDLGPDIMKDVLELKEPPIQPSVRKKITLHDEMVRLLTMVCHQLNTQLHKYGSLLHDL